MIRQSRSRALATALGALAGFGAGCRAATAPVLDPRVAAGTYVLDAPVPRGPLAGSFVLTGDGQASRRVEYAGVSGGPPREVAAAGTFTLVRPDSIAFELREGATGVWRVGGLRTGARFTIRYPHPADGEVVETYRRLDE